MSENEFTHLELRVGKIVKVWKHPESNKLWCEEIDIGEAVPRQVASGLQQVYTEEQMLHTRCVVVCNLRPAKLAGFMSSGMVLCAKSADGSQVS
jgi:methionine--tRNA ligase beta chain